MTTSESNGRFFLQNESIRIDSHNESNRIYSNRELECSSSDALLLLNWCWLRSELGTKTTDEPIVRVVPRSEVCEAPIAPLHQWIF